MPKKFKLLDVRFTSMSASTMRPVSTSKLTVVTPSAIESCPQFSDSKMTEFEFGPSGLYSTRAQFAGPALCTAIEGKPVAQEAAGQRANELTTSASVPA